MTSTMEKENSDCHLGLTSSDRLSGSSDSTSKNIDAECPLGKTPGTNWHRRLCCIFAVSTTPMLLLVVLASVYCWHHMQFQHPDVVFENSHLNRPSMLQLYLPPSQTEEKDNRYEVKGWSASSTTAFINTLAFDLRHNGTRIVVKNGGYFLISLGLSFRNPNTTEGPVNFVTEVKTQHGSLSTYIANPKQYVYCNITGTFICHTVAVVLNAHLKNNTEIYINSYQKKALSCDNYRCYLSLVQLR